MSTMYQFFRSLELTGFRIVAPWPDRCLKAVLLNTPEPFAGKRVCVVCRRAYSFPARDGAGA